MKSETIITEIDKVGQYLADKFEVPVEKAYDMMMKQCTVDYMISKTYLILAIFLIAATTITCYMIYRKTYEVATPFILFFILNIIWGFMAADSFNRMIQITINPEFYVLKEVMNLIN